MLRKKRILFIALALAVVVGGGFYLKKKSTQIVPHELTGNCTKEAKLCADGSNVGRKGPNCEFEKCPEPKSIKKLDKILNNNTWNTYKHPDLGFELKYPKNYEVAEDTYGWPNAALLLYGGGQSYSLAVEVWESEAEAKKKYNDEENVTSYKMGGKFVTLLNINYDNEVAQIIETFNPKLPD